MNSLSIFTAFGGGVLSFISPCVLPLIPAYITYISGVSLEELLSYNGNAKSRVAINSLLFIAGFSVVFMALGLAATQIGQLFQKNFIIFARAAGIIIFIFGLHTAGILKIKFLYRESKMQVKPGGSAIGAFVLGFAFAFGWTPCVGPILAGILALAAQETTLTRGAVLLLFYSLGLGIPFFLSGLAVDKLLRLIGNFRKLFKTLEIITGIFLIVLGILIFFNMFQQLANVIYSAAPGFIDKLQNIELFFERITAK